MQIKAGYDSLLKRMRGLTSAIFLCAAFGASLAIMMPGLASADSKLRAVVEDLLKQQAALELTQAALQQQITALELNQSLLEQRLAANEQKLEANDAQLDEVEEEIRRKRDEALERFNTAVILAIYQVASSATGNFIPPSPAVLVSAKFAIGDALWEAIETGDYTFVETFAFGVKDNDGDGIPDQIDLCPDEYGTLLLQGCPAQ